MKKIIIVLAFVLTSATMFAQEGYNKWALDIETGLHSVSDESALVTDNYNHFGAGLRYNINEIVGVGIRGGYDNLSMETLQGDIVESNYFRANVEATVGVFEVLRLRHKYINLLAHGGPGMSFNNTDNGYKGRLFNVSGGLTALVKLSRSVAFKADYTTTIHLSQDYTLDGAQRVSNAGINSTVDNLNVGLVFYFGKKKRQHADWAVIPSKLQPTVTNITTIQRNIVERVIQECNCSNDENVYFVNDLPKKGEIGEIVIGIQGLNAIEKIYNLTQKDNKLKVYLNGSASNTDSTTSEYDLELSKRRVEAVKTKLVLLGLNESRIKTNYFGKDKSRSNIHEFARKVSLMVR